MRAQLPRLRVRPRALSECIFCAAAVHQWGEYAHVFNFCPRWGTLRAGLWEDAGQPGSHSGPPTSALWMVLMAEPRGALFTRALRIAHEVDKEASRHWGEQGGRFWKTARGKAAGASSSAP